jgi:hypothetical protein
VRRYSSCRGSGEAHVSAGLACRTELDDMLGSLPVRLIADNREPTPNFYP